MMYAFLRMCRKVSGINSGTFAEQWIYGSGCLGFGIIWVPCVIQPKENGGGDLNEIGITCLVSEWKQWGHEVATEIGRILWGTSLTKHVVYKNASTPQLGFEYTKPMELLTSTSWTFTVRTNDMMYPLIQSTSEYTMVSVSTYSSWNAWLGSTHSFLCQIVGGLDHVRVCFVDSLIEASPLVKIGRDHVINARHGLLERQSFDDSALIA